ncbi:MAG: GIY-YIG nuclease family protein [Opitutales bacterium]|jgi:putative endonuclease|nr:GIY-YIG nuclease family protein [Opitutales bacterium]MDP4643277.1 GIY-YIG nuclease family protein [Opitutales bacterium]MDP4884158.1 GIY-YIG nuclease family protein [Opitutales bacterium]MDP5078931.1 GIY-YIG nuclease family protein [Opitutales bacterium]
MTWSVYILRCVDGTLYTGVAIDVARRFEEHQSQGPKGAKYTRGRGPLKLVYQSEIGTRSEACAEEYRIKQLSRSEKKALVAG